MSRLPLALAALVASAAAQAAVYRCNEPGGSVTYQDHACRGDATGVTDIPTEFPPPNEVERARILQSEASLQKRLEQQRERESREASLRSVATPAPAPVPEPMIDGYPLYYPLGIAHHPIQRPSQRPHPRPHFGGGSNTLRP